MGNLTSEQQRKLIEYVRAGNLPETAVLAVGSSVRVLREWVEAGEAAEEKCATYKERVEKGLRVSRNQKPTDDEVARHEFATALKRAEAEAEVHAVTVMAKAARDGDWRAAQWLLERRNAAEWGRRRPQAPVKDDAATSGARQFFADIYTAPQQQ